MDTHDSKSPLFQKQKCWINGHLENRTLGGETDGKYTINIKISLLTLITTTNIYINQACPTRHPWYTFLAPYFTLPALTLIRISRKKYVRITVCFNFFRSMPMNTVFPLVFFCTRSTAP
jgi:hypothetical protein